MKSETIKVKGMSCEHCQASVEKALGALSGVASAKVDLTAGTAAVEYDEAKVGGKDFERAIKEAGFEVG